MARKKSLDKEKIAAASRMIEEGDYILVHVAPQTEGVELPPHLASLNTVTLKLSRLFRGKTSIEKDRIEADLLFGDRYFTCKFPYPALWGITAQSGEFLVWPESAPSDLFEHPGSQPKKVEKIGDRRKRPELALAKKVPSSADGVTDSLGAEPKGVQSTSEGEPEVKTTPEPSPVVKKTTRPQLKRVK